LKVVTYKITQHHNPEGHISNFLPFHIDAGFKTVSALVRAFIPLILVKMLQNNVGLLKRFSSPGEVVGIHFVSINL
jgi:hypothetical protein